MAKTATIGSCDVWRVSCVSIQTACSRHPVIQHRADTQPVMAHTCTKPFLMNSLNAMEQGTHPKQQAQSTLLIGIEDLSVVT